jgi:hypothetical protein
VYVPYATDLRPKKLDGVGLVLGMHLAALIQKVNIIRDMSEFVPKVKLCSNIGTSWNSILVDN